MKLDSRRGNGDSRSHTRSWNAVITGASGAATVTLAHEVVRQLVPRAPRMDRLGMAALSRVLARFGVKRPRGETLRGLTLLGDIFGNALYYAPIAASRRRPRLSGLLVGALAGLGAVVLTPALGLPSRYRGLTLGTQAMTVALYAAGGLAAGAMAAYLTRSREENIEAA